MQRVIVCSPFSATAERTVEMNTNYARWCVSHSFELGEAPFASHLLYPGVLDDSDQRQRDRGMQAEYEWMAAADIVAFYTDNGWSAGMLKELKVARLLFKKLEIRSCFGREAAWPTAKEHLDANKRNTLSDPA